VTSTSAPDTTPFGKFVVSPELRIVCVMVASSSSTAPDAELTVTVCATFQAVAPLGVKVRLLGDTAAWVVSLDATATVTLPVGADFSWTV